MKKRIAVLFLLGVAAAAAAGCGKESSREEVPAAESYQETDHAEDSVTEEELSEEPEEGISEEAETEAGGSMAAPVTAQEAEASAQEAEEPETVPGQEENTGASQTTAEPAGGADPNALSSTQNTAPMPETDITKEDIIGTWVANPDREEAEIIKIREEGGALKYQISFYINGQGDTNTGLANGYTEMVVAEGNVTVQENWGQFLFMKGESEMDVFSSYYYTKGDNYIMDQKDAKCYYRDDDYVFPFS